MMGHVLDTLIEGIEGGFGRTFFGTISQIVLTVGTLNLRWCSSPNRWGPSDLEGQPLKSQGHLETS